MVFDIRSYMFVSACRNDIMGMPFTAKFTAYTELKSRLRAGDVSYLEGYLKAHVSGENSMASLRSR